MGVLNLTPDSFSDGGADATAEDALARGLGLIEAGADILDLGGESTRPGAEPPPEAVERARVIETLRAIAARSRVPISIDTRRPSLAREAVLAGASIWNDVGALGSPGALETAAELGCEVVLTHMQGEPSTMQADPRYGDVSAEVLAFLCGRATAAERAGVEPSRILIDPGIGFGKRLEDNLDLLRALPRFVATGYRVVLGASRKGFLQGLDRRAHDPKHRLGGSIAAALAGARAGCAVVRAHDVFETRQALLVEAAIRPFSRRPVRPSEGAAVRSSGSEGRRRGRRPLDSTIRRDRRPGPRGS